MELHVDLSQIAPEVNHHGNIQVTHLSKQSFHTSLHMYQYKNVMRSSRLFRVFIFEAQLQINDLGMFSMASNVIRSNYCCRIEGIPCTGTWCLLRTISGQQSGGLPVCSVNSL